MVVAADKMHMVFKKQRSCRNDLKEAMLERADVIKFDQLKDEWVCCGHLRIPFLSKSNG